MSASAALRALEWDSRFFGVPIASVTDAKLSAAQIGVALAEARAQRIACVYVLSSLDDAERLRALERAGGRFVDVRMSFERALEPGDARAADEVRVARASDVPALRAIAAKSHTASRFFADPGFARDRCAALYETWIERSCTGWADFVLVAESDGKPAGYLSGHVRPANLGDIGLVAVDAAAHGRGLGTKLVLGALAEFARRGLARVGVVTQGSNVPAQRLYQSQGFRSTKVEVWHHVWPAESGARA